MLCCIRSYLSHCATTAGSIPGLASPDRFRAGRACVQVDAVDMAEISWWQRARSD
jgi:hypothetical protein